MNRITVAIWITLLSACSSQSRQATAPPTTVAPAAELAAASPAPPTTAVAAATSPPGAPATANLTPDPQLLKEGYKVQTYHGQLMYCRTQEITGSYLTRKVCLTAEQIRARTENAREIMDTRRSDTSCAQLGCN